MIVIAILAVTFFAGALFGVLAVLRLGAGREDRDGSLRGTPSTLAAAAARRLTGLWTWTPPCTAGAQPWQGRQRHGYR